MSWPDIITPRWPNPAPSSLHRVPWPVGDEHSGPIDIMDAREYARITGSVETEYQTVADMLAAAIEYAETATRRTIAFSLWDLVLNDFADVIELRRPPVVEVDEVRYRDGDDAWVVMDPSDYQVALDGDRATVEPLIGASWPGVSSAPRSVRVRYRAGYRPFNYVADVYSTTPPVIGPKLRATICELFAFSFDTRGMGSSNRLIEVAVPSAIDSAFWSERADL